MRALVALLLILAPVAAAQTHEHHNENGMSMVLYDGPMDGRAVVGGYTHFGFALLDKDAAPVPHQNAEFNVVQNGKVLFSTTDTHEYDGLFSLDMRFTKPGPYQVTAHSGDMELGVFEGEVVAAVNETVATIDLQLAPVGGPGSHAVEGTLTISGPDGVLIPHTDAIVEFRDPSSGALYSRSHLHIHDAPIVFTQGLGLATDYTAQVIGYKAFATGRSTDVRAVVAEFPVSVGPLSIPSLPMPELAPPRPLDQVGATAAADGLTLHAMYDPNNQVGIGQAARIAGIVVEDQNMTPKPHVDFAFTLSGPRGTVFSSETLHEYDGMFEYLFFPEVPGSYDGTLKAIYDATEMEVPLHLLVVPPAIAALGGTGPISLSAEGLDDITAGVEKNITFSAMGPTGPAMHSEVDVTVFHDDEPPLYQFKLHTHESGITNAMLLFPHDGDWQIRIDALPTVPEPSVYPPTLLQFTVAPGLPMDTPDDGVLGAVKDDAVPGAWVALTLLAAGMALLARRR